MKLQFSFIFDSLFLIFFVLDVQEGEPPFDLLDELIGMFKIFEGDVTLVKLWGLGGLGG